MGIVYVENIGGLPAGEKSPVSFTLSNVPDYVKLKQVSPSLSAESVEGDVGWDCQGNTCTLVQKTASGTKNAVLDVRAKVKGDLQLDIAKDAQIPQPEEDFLEKQAEAAKSGDVAGFEKLQRTVNNILVTASKDGDIDLTNNESAIQILGERRDGGAVVGGDASVGQAGVQVRSVAGSFIDSTIAATVFPGGPFRLKLRYLPTGTETQSGKIKLSDVVPEGLALSKIKVSGSNWSCNSLTALKTCEMNGPDLAPGSFSEYLVIEGQVGKSAKVGGEELLSWVVSSKTATVIDQSPVVWNVAVSTKVVEAPQSDITIGLQARDEKSNIAPPGSVTVDALVRSLNAGSENVRIKLSIRKGLSFGGLASDAVGWTCKSAAADAEAGEGATAQECIKPEIDLETPETVGFQIGATTDTEVGTALVVGEIAADNEGSKFKEFNKSKIALVVQPQAAPMPGAEISVAGEVGAAKVVTDGSATKIRIGQSRNYSFSAKNLGSVALATGELVRFEQFVDSTAVFSGPAFGKSSGYSASLDSQKINTSTPGKWVCVTGTGNVPQIASPLDAAKAATTTSVAPVTTVVSKKTGPAIRCEIKLATAVAPDKKTPALNLTVKVANTAKTGKPEWPIFVTMLGIPAAPIARYGMTVDIAEDKIELTPSFVAPAGPRPGGQAVATLSLLNSGDTDTKAQFVVVPGVKDGRITGVTGDSWKCARLGTALASGFTI
jgi:hypothetical protein